MAAPVKLTIGELVPVYRVQLLDGYGNPVDLTGATVKFQFRRKDSQTFVIDSSANVVVNDATNGDVQYNWQPGDTDTGGIYQARWHVTFADNSILVYPSDVGDTVLITSGPNLGFNVGPCTPWTNVEAVRYCCGSIDSNSEGYVPDDIVQEQIDVASDYLYAASGRVFSGECLTAIRPESKRGCFGRYTNAWYVDNAIANGTYPFFYNWPEWGCGCNAGSVLRLGHYPVTNIVTVTLDGVVLDPSDYRLDQYRWLRRLDGGTWPTCQRLDLPTTDIGTFEVLMEHGMTVPPLGVQAARDLACELTKECGGGGCDLPVNTTSAVRQGVSISMEATRDLRNNIPSVNLFLDVHNPSGLRRRPTVISPDFPLMAVLDGLRDHLRQYAFNVTDTASEEVREETARDAPYPFGERVTISNVDESGDVFSVVIGVEIEPFEWEYGDPGARQNPFEPHEELGSREFLDVDDPDLANELSFPSVQFFSPQDHEGCLCETVPTSGDIANPWFADPLPERWRDALQQASGQETLMSVFFDVSEQILQHALDGLDMDRQPARSYVSTGVPAHDVGLRRDACDGVLAVHIRNMRNWHEGKVTEQCAFRPTLDLTVTIVRCATAWQGNQAPSIETLAEESDAILGDIEGIFFHLAELWTTGSLFDCQVACTQVRFGRMVPSGPLGGAAAWTLDLTIIDPSTTCNEGS